MKNGHVDRPALTSDPRVGVTCFPLTPWSYWSTVGPMIETRSKTLGGRDALPLTSLVTGFFLATFTSKYWKALSYCIDGNQCLLVPILKDDICAQMNDSSARKNASKLSQSRRCSLNLLSPALSITSTSCVWFQGNHSCQLSMMIMLSCFANP